MTYPLDSLMEIKKNCLEDKSIRVMTLDSAGGFLSIPLESIPEELLKKLHKKYEIEEDNGDYDGM